MKRYFRSLISWAAGKYFPNTVFYGHPLAGIESDHDSKAFVSLVTCFPNTLKKPGDVIKVTAMGVDYKGVDIGDYIITVERIDPKGQQ